MDHQCFWVANARKRCNVGLHWNKKHFKFIKYSSGSVTWCFVNIEYKVFMDQKNLLLTFHPVLAEPSIACNKIMKVAIWTLFLSTFGYVIEHVHRDSNDFTDMLTRSRKVYRSSKRCIYPVRKSFAYFSIPSLPYNTNLIWSDCNLFINAQSQFEVPPNCTKDEGGVVLKARRVCILSDAYELKVRLPFVA